MLLLLRSHLFRIARPFPLACMRSTHPAVFFSKTGPMTLDSTYERSRCQTQSQIYSAESHNKTSINYFTLNERSESNDAVTWYWVRTCVRTDTIRYWTPLAHDHDATRLGPGNQMWTPVAKYHHSCSYKNTLKILAVSCVYCVCAQR